MSVGAMQSALPSTRGHPTQCQSKSVGNHQSLWEWTTGVQSPVNHGLLKRAVRVANHWPQEVVTMLVTNISGLKAFQWGKNQAFQPVIWGAINYILDGRPDFGGATGGVRHPPEKTLSGLALIFQILAIQRVLRGNISFRKGCDTQLWFVSHPTLRHHAIWFFTVRMLSVYVIWYIPQGVRRHPATLRLLAVFILSIFYSYLSVASPCDTAPSCDS